MAKNNQELLARLNQKQEVAIKNPARTIADMLESNKTEIAKALPTHVTVDRFLKATLTTIRENPKLMACTAESLVAAIYTCAQVGLEPGPLGHIYLIPYKNSKQDESGNWVKVNEVEVQIGYKGLLELVYRGKEIEYLAASPVYENEKVVIDRATGHVEHPFDFNEEPGKLVGFYAIARTKGGQTWVEPIRLEEMDRIADMSPDSPAWKNFYEEMGRKVALKRLCKKLPISIEAARAIATEDAHLHKSPSLVTPVPTFVAPATPAIEPPPVAIEPEITDPEVLDANANRRAELKKQAEDLINGGAEK